MNSVISAFKTKKNSSQSALGSQNGVSGPNDKHNNLSMISSTLSTSSSKKKASINAQDNGYQYLRHIREIDTATKLLSPVVMPDDLLETDMLNFRPASVTPIPVPVPAAGIDVVDHVPMQAVRLTPPTIETTNTDCNMNGGKSTANISMSSLDNGNESSLEDHSVTLTNGQHSLSNSPTQHLVDAEDDESEHSTANCTSTTSSSSSDQSNSTVVHSPIAPTAAAAATAAAVAEASATSSTQPQSQQMTHPSPAKSLNLSLSSNTSLSLSSSISVSSNSTNSLALLNSGPSSCSSSATGCDISGNDYSQPSSPTMVTRNAAANSEYVPAFLKSSNVTLPIIMPNSNSSLASLPPNQTPANSATTTPKHTRYSKPRLSLSRFINHSMPSVHGRPNLSIAGGAAGSCVGINGQGIAGAGGTTPPKRASTHQRNLSLDFR